MSTKSRTENRLSLARVWVRSNVITTVLIVFILLSLALHALTIGQLLRVRRTTHEQLRVSANELARVRQQRVRFDFPINETFRVDTTVAISETIAVPIDITVPISETIRLPIDTPVGVIDFDVPLNLEVPISDTVAIPIQREIPFQADIPVQTDLPIDIDLNESPLGAILQQFEESLRQLSEGL